MINCSWPWRGCCYFVAIVCRIYCSCHSERFWFLLLSPLQHSDVILTPFHYHQSKTRHPFYQILKTSSAAVLAPSNLPSPTDAVSPPSIVVAVRLLYHKEHDQGSVNRLWPKRHVLPPCHCPSPEAVRSGRKHSCYCSASSRDLLRAIILTWWGMEIRQL